MSEKGHPDCAGRCTWHLVEPGFSGCTLSEEELKTKETPKWCPRMVEKAKPTRAELTGRITTNLKRLTAKQLKVVDAYVRERVAARGTVPPMKCPQCGNNWQYNDCEFGVDDAETRDEWWSTCPKCGYEHCVDEG